MARLRQIYQFRLSLDEVRPQVWRRIQVAADYTLARLQKVIQAVMDWQDYSLHEFTVADWTYGPPDPEEEHQVLDEGGCSATGPWSLESGIASSMSMTSAIKMASNFNAFPRMVVRWSAILSYARK